MPNCFLLLRTPTYRGSRRTYACHNNYDIIIMTIAFFLSVVYLTVSDERCVGL